MLVSQYVVVIALAAAAPPPPPPPITPFLKPCELSCGSLALSWCRAPLNIVLSPGCGTIFPAWNPCAIIIQYVDRLRLKLCIVQCTSALASNNGHTTFCTSSQPISQCSSQSLIMCCHVFGPRDADKPSFDDLYASASPPAILACVVSWHDARRYNSWWLAPGRLRASSSSLVGFADPGSGLSITPSRLVFATSNAKLTIASASQGNM